MKRPDRPRAIGAILDRSALESYARGHVHVGELIQQVTDENDGSAVGIPSAALVEALARVAHDKTAKDLLKYVTTLGATVVLPLDQTHAAGVAANVPLVRGDLARAHAIWAAQHHETLCFTAEPEAVPEAILTDQIITIPRDDA
ncbi:hypothetical protein [Krasilnikovia sp. M28-CT-15]|uniref:hypothetical protein n=1 Tax=Krasilnikovia sp. M28-CT-15 TaxID=3373540 RepID=UPI003876752C